MAYAGDGLPYPPQPGFTAVPQDHQLQNSNPWQNQPQGLPVPSPQISPPAPYISAVPNTPSGLEYSTQVDQVLIHQKRDDLPYPAQPGFNAVPQDHQLQNSNPWQNQPQGPPVPGPQISMPAPYIPPVPNIPSGLEYLTQVDQVLIHQKRHSLFQFSCEYDILNAVSQRIFYAQQERECCGPLLDVRIYDNSQHHILHLLLPSKFCSWQAELEVYSPTSGGLIGYVVKNWAAFAISFSILNIAKECVLKVVGPGFGMAAFSDINFEVKTSNESNTVGRITREWRGVRKEMFSSNDHYSVQFPINLDAKVKALLMSTGIFIDYVYFEERARNHRMNQPMNHHTNHMNMHMNHMNIHRQHHMNHMNHHHRHHR